MTGPDVIVNDVFVDPANPDHVLLATDRGGGHVQQRCGESASRNSNQGFSARKVEALLVDPENPAHIFAGVVNDKSYGGVFVSSDGGARWKQIADGLDGRDVFVLAQAVGWNRAGRNQWRYLRLGRRIEGMEGAKHHRQHQSPSRCPRWCAASM